MDAMSGALSSTKAEGRSAATASVVKACNAIYSRDLMSLYLIVPYHDRRANPRDHLSLRRR
eukprot:COSAG02_NODE_22490_length_750_cov_2.172043_1_plen_60_part_10